MSGSSLPSSSPAVRYAPALAKSKVKHASSSSVSSYVSPKAKWAPRREQRSRSPALDRPGIPALRDGAPSRLAGKRARMPDLTSQEAQDLALMNLEKGVKADSTHISDNSRLRSMASWLSQWKLELFPPSVATVKALAASLKAGGYRSAEVYLTVYRRECERRGFEVGSLLRGDLKDYRRSCERGLGGAVRPRALPMELFGGLPASRTAWVAEGPLNPKAAIICGSWWLCREVELSTARARLVEIRWEAVPPLATWHLPTSKADPQALGMARTLRCNCMEFGKAGCPVHVMWDRLAFLRTQLTDRWLEDGPVWDLPFFLELMAASFQKRR